MLGEGRILALMQRLLIEVLTAFMVIQTIGFHQLRGLGVDGA